MDTKYCPHCDTDKPVEDFGKNKSKKDGLQSVCTECKRGYGQRHYQANKEAYAANARSYQRRLRAEIAEIKEASPCTDCGLFYPWYVMQFDHLGDKLDGVAKLVSNAASRERIMIEIAKCELVCSNCHCVRTHERRVATGEEDEYTGR